MVPTAAAACAALGDGGSPAGRSLNQIINKLISTNSPLKQISSIKVETTIPETQMSRERERDERNLIHFLVSTSYE